MPLSSRRVARSWFPAFIVLFSSSSFPKTGLGQEVILQNDSVDDGDTVAIQAGFVQGEIGAASFNPPPEVVQFPVQLVAIRIMWCSLSQDTGQTLGEALHVYAGTLPPSDDDEICGDLPSCDLGGPSMSDCFLNEFDVSDLNIIIDEPPFTVGFEFAEDPDIFNGPSLCTDVDGCQNNKNWVRLTNGTWTNLCSFGVSGDLVIRAVVVPTEEQNGPPVADDVFVTTAEDTATTVTLSATDPENDTLSYIIETLPAHGDLSDSGGPITSVPHTIPGNGNEVTYTPDPGYSGPDLFDYHANDGTSNSNTATAFIDVVTNDPPVAEDVAAVTNLFDKVDITLPATDDGVPGPLSYTIESLPGIGKLRDPGAGSDITSVPYTLIDNGDVVEFHPVCSAGGETAFTFTASDSVTDSNVATATVTMSESVSANTVGAYLFNEGTPGDPGQPGPGSTQTDYVQDASGRGHHGTMTSTSISYVTDLPADTPDGALSVFYGVNGGILVNDHADLKIACSFTLEGFFKFSAGTIVSGNNDALIVKRGTAAFDYGLWRRGTNSGKDLMIAFRTPSGGNFGGGTHWAQIVTVPDLAEDTWYHIAGVYDVADNTLRLYLNYEEIGTAQAVPDDVVMSSSTGKLAIGREGSNNAQHFRGTAEYVRITRKALAAGQLLKKTDTAALYLFNEGSPSDPGNIGPADDTADWVIDSSVNENHGTAAGPQLEYVSPDPPSGSPDGGLALSFDGTGAVTVPDTGSLRLSASFTIEGFFNFAFGSVNEFETHALVVKGTPDFGWDYGLWRMPDNEGKSLLVGFRVGDGGGNFDDGLHWAQLVELADLPEETWHHVAGVYDRDAQTLRLFLNYEEVGSPLEVTDGPAVETSNGALALGQNGDLFDSFFPGVMDHVRLTNRALDVSEFAGFAEVPCTPADMNDDGLIDGDDVGVFVEVLMNGGTPQQECAGDLEDSPDGMVDPDDVPAFVACLLSAGGCQP